MGIGRLSFLYFIIFQMTVGNTSLQAQRDFFSTYEFSHADSLRGNLGPERSCYQLGHYDLSLEIDVDKRKIHGKNVITVKSLCNNQRVIQIDLFSRYQIHSIKVNDLEVKYKRDGNAIFITLPKEINTIIPIEIEYSGEPQVARTPPWDGGFIWITDEKNRPWISVACQGLGASSWWPCIDHQAFEPDSMKISVSGPAELDIISNGIKTSDKIKENKREVVWKIHAPINSYNVNVSLGHYQHFYEQYLSSTGELLDLDYYVLDYNLKKAKKHFKEVHGVLEAFEFYFGPYPYYKDGYALIETPFLGMEHQSGIAYGNQYQYGYFGKKALPNMNWDYIIVHETGHEWFGNYLTSKHIGDLWLHEAFTTYSEALYVEYHYDYNTSIDYLQTQRKHRNAEPLVGPYHVHFDDWVSSDAYYKGTWILHTLRHVIDNDSLWFDLLKSYVLQDSHRTVEAVDFINYVNEFTGDDYSSFFDQYLYYPTIPALEYTVKVEDEQKCITYKWISDVEGFSMPFDIVIGDEKVRLFPTDSEWKEYCYDGDLELKFRDDLFLFDLKKKE